LLLHGLVGPARPFGPGRLGSHHSHIVAVNYSVNYSAAAAAGGRQGLLGGLSGTRPDRDHRKR
jgi:hypothetical protein